MKKIKRMKSLRECGMPLAHSIYVMGVPENEERSRKKIKEVMALMKNMNLHIQEVKPTPDRV